MFENPINIYKKPEKKTSEMPVKSEYLGKRTLARAMAAVTFLVASMAAEMPAKAAEIKVDGVKVEDVDKDFFNLNKASESSSGASVNFNVNTGRISGSTEYNSKASSKVGTENLNPENSFKQKDPNNFIEESGGNRKSVLIGGQR